MPNWGEILQEINGLQFTGKVHIEQAFDLVRRKYLKALYDKFDRNIIAYYSGWLSKPGIALQEINDEDKNGFMMAIHKMSRNKGLDLILHTPGGSVASAQSIVNYIHKMFGRDVRAIIPQMAMSAGTMIACSCREIVMGKHSNLGPIDPHVRNIPAYGVVEEFKRAIQEVKGSPRAAGVWQPIINQYRPAFLGQCEYAIDWSNKFVEDQLATGMFAEKGKYNDTFKETKKGRRKAKKVAKSLADYATNKSHERHIHEEECLDIGLNVKSLEANGEFQDLILTIHHCYMHSLMNTPAFKFIENHDGIAFIKQQAVTLVGQQGLRPNQIGQPIGDSQPA
jgi:Serine dehydrogenase proteinase